MSFLHVLRRSPHITAICQRYASSSAAPAPKVKAQKAPEKIAASPAAAVQSSCPPDTVLKGLNYLKGQPTLLALPDEQYPDWLWTVLKPKEYPDDGPGGKAERVKRRKERQQAIKDSNFMSTQ